MSIVNEYGAWADVMFSHSVGAFQGRHRRFGTHSLSRAAVYGADRAWFAFPLRQNGTRLHSGRFLGAILTGLAQMAPREYAIVTAVLAAVRDDDADALVAYNVFKCALRVTRAARKRPSVGTIPPAAAPLARS